MGRILAFLYGIVAYAAFLGAFAYAIGFVGNIAVPKGIDSGAAGAFLPAVGVNVALLLLFAIQHSGMARPGFKRWWTKIVPEPIERSTYVLLASAALFLLYWLWQPLPQTVWHVEQPAARTVLWTIFGFGWTTVLFATVMIGHFDLFGLRQVWLNLRGRVRPDDRFRTPMLYKIIRHPIMTGFLLAFWATPDMSVGHLLFTLVTTGYIVVAVKIEERDLIAQFGELYRAYRQRVPGFFPRFGRAWREDAAPARSHSGGAPSHADGGGAARSTT